MPRYVALLRAVNVGGRFVRMPALVAAFENLGFSDVATFLASGNVVFRARAAGAAARARRIEAALHDALGFEVAAFVRTESDIRAIPRREPFPAARLAQAKALNVVFLEAELTAAQQAQLHALRSQIDEFAVVGTEIFWLCRRRQSESKISNAVLERKLGVRSTVRGYSTVQRLGEILAG
jgi:uncharacterized protein (DUF1697 family)